MNTTTHSHSTWTDKGGHVIATTETSTPESGSLRTASVIGSEAATCQQRAHLYEKARQTHPRCWSRFTLSWHQVKMVSLNKPPEGPETILVLPLNQTPALMAKGVTPSQTVAAPSDNSVCIHNPVDLIENLSGLSEEWAQVFRFMCNVGTDTDAC